MRIIVLDSGLRHRHGHHDHFARGLTRTLAKLGKKARYLAQVDIDPELQVECNATPFFRGNHYSVMAKDRYDMVMRDAIPRGRMYEEDLDQLGPDAITDDDLVLVPTATAVEIVALLRWRTKRKLNFKIAFMIHRLSPLTLDDMLPGSQLISLWRSVYRASLKLDPSRMAYATMTDGLAQRLSPVLGRTLSVMNSQEFITLPLTRRPTVAGDRLRLGFLGPARMGKNYGLLTQLGPELRQRKLPIDVIIQATSDKAVDTDSEGVTMKHLSGWMDDLALETMMASLDILALPYERSSYVFAASGLFCMAAALGRPVVAPSGTWMAEMIEKGQAAGVIYDGDGASDLADAVAIARDNIETLQADAYSRAETWRRKYGGEIVVRGILRWAMSPPKPRAEAPVDQKAVPAT